VKELALQIVSFAKERKRGSSWFYRDDYGMKIYVRKNIRVSCGEAIDIASVDILELFRGQGLFSSLLEELENISPYSLYAESVINTRLANYLVKRGWTMDRGGGYHPLSPSYIYTKQQNMENK